MDTSFKTWFCLEFAMHEMAFVSKRPYIMGEDEIRYLQQFPPVYWMQALEQRFSNLLLSAVTPDGQLKPDWNDAKTLSFRAVGRGAGTVTFNVDSGVSRIVKKLLSLGYEIKKPNLETMTALYFSPMGRSVSNMVIKAARKSANGKTIDKTVTRADGKSFVVKMLDVQPNFYSWVPNKLEQSRNDYAEPIEMQKGLGEWDKLKETIQKEVPAYVDSELKRASDPNFALHINYFYWSQPDKRKELIEKAVGKLWMNLKDPKVQKQGGRAAIVKTYVWNVLQSGHISRRNIQRMKVQGTDPNAMLYSKNPKTRKNYTIPDIVSMANPSNISSYQPIVNRRKVA